jgi:hypothetical protein
MAVAGRCSSLPLMLVTMKRVPQLAGVRLRFASAVPCQCAIAIFVLRDRDAAKGPAAGIRRGRRREYESGTRKSTGLVMRSLTGRNYSPGLTTGAYPTSVGDHARFAGRPPRRAAERLHTKLAEYEAVSESDESAA